MKILIRFKRRCINGTKGALCAMRRVFVNKINIYDTLISQLILTKKYVFLALKTDPVSVKVTLRDKLTAGSINNQLAPAFVAGIFNILFFAFHYLFNARAVGPAGALAYGEYL